MRRTTALAFAAWLTIVSQGTVSAGMRETHDYLERVSEDMESCRLRRPGHSIALLPEWLGGRYFHNFASQRDQDMKRPTPPPGPSFEEVKADLHAIPAMIRTPDSGPWP